MRAAALDGSIEDLMTWHVVAPGDFFYIPANTVHAIGAGVNLIEVQQNSDVTYRLYEPPPARAASGGRRGSLASRDLCARPLARESAATCLASVGRLPAVRAGSSRGGPFAGHRGALLVTPREGAVDIAGQTIAPGTCGLAASLADVHFADNGTCLLARAYTDPP